MQRSQTTPISVESWGWSRQGACRTENQDSFLNWPECLLWAVADGMGGGRDGGPASRLVMRNLLRISCPPSLGARAESVKHLLNRSNSQLRSASSSGITACTVVALLIHEDRAACLWAGDSRCYLLRDNALYLCTRDHTVRQRKIDGKELTAHEAERMVRGNILTSAVGIRNELRTESAEFVLRAGDRFLLCSDGLSNHLSPETLALHLGRPNARDSAMAIARDLDRHEPPDDATLITVFLSGA